MAYFKVLLHGSGISIQDTEAGPSLIGFYTTRLVRASTAADAKGKATSLVESEWSTGGQYEANGSAGMCVSVEAVHESSLFESLSFGNRGYTFYSSGGEPVA